MVAFHTLLRRWHRLVPLSLGSLRVDTLNIRVRGCNTSLGQDVGINNLLNLFAGIIDHACACLVTCLKLNLALEFLDLLRVEDIAILVAVLDALLSLDETLSRRDWRFAHASILEEFIVILDGLLRLVAGLKTLCGRV